MLSEVEAELANIERRLQTGDDQQRWAAMEERLRAAEQSNAAQWDAMEQLMLALFRQPQFPASDSE